MRTSWVVVLTVAAVLYLDLQGSAVGGDFPVELAKAGPLKYQWANLSGLRYSLVSDEEMDGPITGRMYRFLEYDFSVGKVSETGGVFLLPVRAEVRLSGSRERDGVRSNALICTSEFSVDVDEYGEVLRAAIQSSGTNNATRSDARQVAASALPMFLGFVVVRLPRQGSGPCWVNGCTNDSAWAGNDSRHTVWTVENISEAGCELVARNQIISGLQNGGSAQQSVDVGRWEARYVYDREAGIVRSAQVNQAFDGKAMRRRLFARVALSEAAHK